MADSWLNSSGELGLKKPLTEATSPTMPDQRNHLERIAFNNQDGGGHSLPWVWLPALLPFADACMPLDESKPHFCEGTGLNLLQFGNSRGIQIADLSVASLNFYMG